jgi:hypothetical protein
MTYHVRTEQTAKFPLYVFAGRAESELQEPVANTVVDYTKAPSLAPAYRRIPSIAFVDVDLYPEVLDGLTRPVPGFALISAANATVYGLASTPMQIEAGAGAFVSTNAAEPLVATLQSIPGSATNTVAATLLVVEDVVAVAKAKARIEEARTVALGGDLRGAYRLVYRGLDELFRRGKCVKRHRTRDQDRRRRVDHSLGCGAAAPSLEARSVA